MGKVTDNHVKNITKKISQSDFFMALVTKMYLEKIRYNDERALAYINIARELKKPFFVIVDSRLKCSEAMQANIYFSNDNVIKKLMVDMDSNKDILCLANNIIELARTLTHNDKEIRIATDDMIEFDDSESCLT